MRTAGILLAAGAGRRMGTPKALLRHVDGRSWLETSLAALVDGGCEPVAVVLGAEADRARQLLPPCVAATVLVNSGWRAGMGSSLRLALEWCMRLEPQVGTAMVMLVDTPGVGAEVVGHLRAQAMAEDVLARATFRGDTEPGHPVLLGRAHWAGIHADCSGDEGARRYFKSLPPRLIDCTAWGSGADVDALNAPAPPPSRRRP
jgi:CTP:molybdopterin cytidylyltransferase MocA